MAKKIIFCTAFVPLTLFVFPFLSWGMDAGLVLDQTAAWEEVGTSEGLFYSASLVPWLSAPLGGFGEAYISAAVTGDYADEAWNIIPELLRTELAFRFGEAGQLRVGRLNYADPLGFIAEGLFDGAQFTADLGESVLGAGVWYTGLLYKKTANITMTEEDLSGYYAEFEYADFWDTYFAPRRLIAALDWEHPGLSEIIRLRLSLMGQFDLGGGETYYHSQYITGKLSVPVRNFIFELGASAARGDASGENEFSFAGELSAAWMPPTAVTDRLLLMGRFSGGGVSDTITAFVPVTTESCGFVLKAKLSGLSMISLDYTARLHKTFSAGISGSCFVLSDMGTYQGLPSGRDGYFLGNEFFGHLTWRPVSDLRIKAGGGAFLPMLGNADPEGKIQWRVELNAVFVIF